MKEYHKIQSVFKRDPKTNRFIDGAWSLPELEYLKNNIWVFTEKVDGTNIRVMWNGEAVSFGGKTDNAQMPMFLLYKLQELFEGTAKKQLFKEQFQKDGVPFGDVCFYGEGYGAKIQKGGGNYKPDGVDFVLFDVKIGEWYLERENVEAIGSLFGIRVVPIIGEGTLAEAISMVKAGFNSQWGEFQAEGIVARPKMELKSRSGERIITKVKHRDFI